MLSTKDSNLNQLIQSQRCCRYTNGDRTVRRTGFEPAPTTLTGWCSTVKLTPVNLLHSTLSKDLSLHEDPAMPLALLRDSCPGWLEL